VSGGADCRGFAQATGIVEPGLSQQLGALRKAGLVAAKPVFCALSNEELVEVTAAMAKLAPAGVAPTAAPVSQHTPALDVVNFARMP